MIGNIKDLQFKKGDFFRNEYFWIRYDNIYLSDEFAKLYIKEYKQKVAKITFTPTIISLAVQLNYSKIHLDIYFRELDFSGDNDKKKYKWLVCGSSGSHGFNGMAYLQKENFGVRTKRMVIRYIVNLYLENKLLNRKEKLKEILK